MNKLSYQVLEGEQVKPYIDKISELRIKYFKKFPYLYEGSLEYEKKYMEGFSKSCKSFIVLVKDHETIIGFATAIPLAEDSDIAQNVETLFSSKSLNINDFYYIGEVILELEYRRQGILAELVKYTEEKILSNGFSQLCFLAVCRSKHHPLRPKNYKNLDIIFEHCGYKKSDMEISYEWPTIMEDNKVINMPNPMVFWFKSMD